MEQERGLMDGDEAWRSFCRWQVFGFRRVACFLFGTCEEVEDEEVEREVEEEEEVRFAFVGALPKIRLQLRCPFFNHVFPDPPTQSHSFLLCAED